MIKVFLYLFYFFFNVVISMVVYYKLGDGYGWFYFWCFILITGFVGSLCHKELDSM